MSLQQPRHSINIAVCEKINRSIKSSYFIINRKRIKLTKLTKIRVS